MTLRLATLNLWDLNDWARRFPAAVEALRSQAPDILIMQEVARDPAGHDQARALAAALDFPHSLFIPFDVRRHPEAPPDSTRMHDTGLGIVSRLPFTAEKVVLPYRRVEARGLLVARVDVGGDISGDRRLVTIANAHFDNTDEGSLTHLDETIGALGDEFPDAIIGGDLNCYDTTAIRQRVGETHAISIDVTTYVSYPEDGASLDYILVPKRYRITNVICDESDISDHRMVVVDIDIGATTPGAS